MSRVPRFRPATSSVSAARWYVAWRLAVTGSCYGDGLERGLTSSLSSVTAFLAAPVHELFTSPETVPARLILLSGSLLLEMAPASWPACMLDNRKLALPRSADFCADTGAFQFNTWTSP